MPVDKNGISGTIIFHTIFLLLVLIFGFSTPLPLPGERGILINFGTSSTGLGDIEPAMAEPARREEANEPAPPAETQPSQSENALMTQDFEEAPTVPVKKETTKKKTEPVKETVKPVEQPKTEEKPVEQPRRPDPRSLYTGKNTASQSTGSEGDTKPGGNQGSPDGDVDSPSRIGGPTGGGVGYSLEGRGKVYLPEPSLNYQQQGVVVVEILVDRDGKVVSAREGVKGSTTTNVTLLRLAREAALKSKFSAKTDAPVHQKGTITYHFTLR
ncbi:MAG: TonB family protein [Bacteroidales bacterium]